jgi:cyclopropane fatty-acyl-phospholipid synthase-like methyltransferase
MGPVPGGGRIGEDKMLNSGLLAVNNDGEANGRDRRSTNLVQLKQRIEGRSFAHLTGRGEHLADPLDEGPLTEEGRKITDQLVDLCKWQAQVEKEHTDRVDGMIGDFSLDELFGVMEEVNSNPGIDEDTKEKALDDIRLRIEKRLDEEDDPWKSSYHLFESWASTYDPHMAETNHDSAGETTVKQALELRKLGFGDGNFPILGNDVLEMSSGTGTIIRHYCDNMTPEELAGMNFTLNDQSPKMMKKAIDKLGDDCNYTFTASDLRDPQTDFRHEDPETKERKPKYDTVILANTLHILADPELQRREKDPDAVMESRDHRRIKTEVIKKAFAALKDNGYFVMIDEWEATLSDNPRTPVERIHKRLFKENFRPIASRSIFRDRIMRRIPGALFVGELKARIDSTHSMYMLIYKKDPTRMGNDIKRLPSHEVDAAIEDLDIADVTMARERAANMIQNAFTAIDPHFIETYTPVNGERQNWVDFIPIGAGTRVNPTLEELEAGEKFDTVVVSRQLHFMDEEKRQRYFKLAVDAVNKGGAFMVIDEWDPPSNAEHQLNRRAFRDGMMEEFTENMIFEASLRQTIMEGYHNGMFGYLYRKIH